MFVIVINYKEIKFFIIFFVEFRVNMVKVYLMVLKIELKDIIW